MANAIIEHVNLAVSDPERTAAIMRKLFGWDERWRGPARDDGFTIHVGGETTYLALYISPGGPHPAARYDKGVPFNHVGILVDDLDATEAKVIAAGLMPFSHGNYAPGRRFYFTDADNIEYEIVSYS